jgi:GNAT superfamily N-acetyltransferase
MRRAGCSCRRGWREEAAVARAVGWRVDACARAGLGRVVERLRFEWTSEAPLPAGAARLRLVEEADDAVWIAMFAQIGEPDAERTFDGYVRAAISRGGWRVAYAGDEPIGVTMPSAVDGGDVIAFVGVVPEHRGRGHSHELLAHATHHLAGRGASRIAGDTDATNIPMAVAFRRAGYCEVARRLVVTR